MRFFKTVAVVTVFSVCEKFLGFLYRVFLSRTIGAEGMGLYQTAMSVFAFLFTLCVSGTPVTVSRLMTKYKANGEGKRVNKIISAGVSWTLFISIPIVIAFIIFKNKIGWLFADSRSISIFYVVLPSLIFTCVYAVLRGVFWGNSDFLIYSVIELLEEISMICCGVILITNVSDISHGAFLTGVSVSVSYLFSFALALICFFVRKNKFTSPKGELKPLLASALPVTAMRTTSSLISSLISIILPLRLMNIGLSKSLAMSQYGGATGLALPILCAPNSLIGSFTLVLIPEISQNFYGKNYNELKENIEKSIKFTVFSACIFVPVFIVCGEELGIVLFDSAECGKYLSFSAIMIVFMDLSNLSTSMLNSIGLENKSLVFYLIGAVGMLGIIWFMPKYMGIYSLFVGMSFLYVVTAVCNLRLLGKSCPIKPQYKDFILFSVLYIIPTAILGLMLEKILVLYLGIFATLILVSGILVVFNVLLYMVTGLVSVDYIKMKLPKIIYKTKKSEA